MSIGFLPEWVRGLRQHAALRALRTIALVASIFICALPSSIRTAQAFQPLPALASSNSAVRVSPSSPSQASPTLELPSDVAWALRSEAVSIPMLPAGYETRIYGAWLTLAYPKGTEARVAAALDGIDLFREKLREELGESVLSNVEVRIVREPDEIAALSPFAPPDYAVGVSFGGLRYVLISLKAPNSYEGTDVATTLHHELVHVAIDDAFGDKHVPRWFNEGYATFKAGEARLHAEVLSNAVYMHTMIPLSELDRRFPSDRTQVSVAYGEAADFVRFLLRGADSKRFRSMVERARGGAVFERAIADAYGSELRTLEYQWKKELESKGGSLTAIMTGSLLWVFGFIAILIGYFQRKKQHKVIEHGWHREEQLQSAATTESAVTEDFQIPVVVRVPKVEHEGDWHTLH
jgi:Peptidase MA superfamily